MKTIFAKFNTERLPQFQTVTKVLQDNTKKIAVKEPLNLEAIFHIQKIYTNYQNLEKQYHLNLALPRLENNKIYFDLAKGKSLQHLLAESFYLNDTIAIYNLLSRYLEFIDTLVDEKNVIFEPSMEFEQIFGKWNISDKQDLIKIPNIDLIFSNIFIDNERIEVIDYEWVFSFPIPKHYIIARAFIKFSEIYPIDINHYCNLSEESIKNFIQMEENFYNYVFGEDRKYFLSTKVLKKQIDFEQEHVDYTKKIEQLKNKEEKLLIENNLLIEKVEYFKKIAQNMRIKNRLPKFISKYI